MAAAAIALAACSGGGGLNEDEAAGILQELKEAKAQAATDVAARVAAETQAAAALAAQQTAEAGKLKAEAEKTAAETARESAVTNAEAAQKAAEDAAASAREAAAALVVAQAAEQKAKADQKEAEDDRDAAETALATARQQLQTARAATTAEEQRRQQAEAEQDRLAQVAEDAQQQVDQASARTVLVGLGGLDEEMASIISAPDLAVTPSYRAAAGVRGTPNVTFDKSRATTGSQGRWLRTSYSNRGASSVDRMDVYSDVDASTSIPFKDSDYNDGSSDNSVVGKFDAALVGTTVVNAEGDVVNWLGVMDTQDDTASSAFPRTSATGVKSFSLIDREDSPRWDTTTLRQKKRWNIDKSRMEGGSATPMSTPSGTSTKRAGPWAAQVARTAAPATHWSLAPYGTVGAISSLLVLGPSAHRAARRACASRIPCTCTSGGGAVRPFPTVRGRLHALRVVEPSGHFRRFVVVSDLPR